MEFLLLAKVGMVVNAIVNGGYCLAGGYFIKTAITYIKDYKESVARDNEVR